MILIFLGEMQCIEFRLMLSSYVCVGVCVGVCVYVRACACVCVCVYAAFVDLRKTVWDRDVVFFFKLRGITPEIIYKSLTQIGLQIPKWWTNSGRETLIGLTKPFINDRDFVFFH